MDLFTEYKRFGVFGPSESGKTTLSKKIATEIFVREKRFAIVLSPNDPQKWAELKFSRVFTDKELFWKFCNESNNCLLIMDDGSETINRDADLNTLFTSLRHRGHKVLVIGHHATNLLPQMREALQRVFLFLQNSDSVEHWKKVFPGQSLDMVCDPAFMQQYEFVTVANYKQMIKSKVKP